MIRLFRKARRAYLHETRPPKPPPPPAAPMIGRPPPDPSKRYGGIKPIPPGPVSPPQYMGAETCAECWEPFGSIFPPAFIERWLHRRKWGHNPTSLHPLPLTKDQQHHLNVIAARNYRQARSHDLPQRSTDDD